MLRLQISFTNIVAAIVYNVRKNSLLQVVTLASYFSCHNVLPFYPPFVDLLM